MGPKSRTADVSSRFHLKWLHVVLFLGFSITSYWIFSELNRLIWQFDRKNDLERGTSLYSEQAFYMSYFLRPVEAKTWSEALDVIVRDRNAEFPDVVNPLNRFNVISEALLALLYRALPAALQGDVYKFVLTAIFALSGLIVGTLYVLGVRLSNGNVLSGVLCAASFILQLFEATRVQAHPLLRENFSLPFLWLELLALWHVFRSHQRKPHQGLSALLYNRSYWALFACLFCFVITWQFAQFVLLLQVASLFAVYLLDYLPRDMLRNVVLIHLITAISVSAAMFGNTMVLTSLWVSISTSLLLLLSLPVALPASASSFSSFSHTGASDVDISMLPRKEKHDEHKYPLRPPSVDTELARAFDRASPSQQQHQQQQAAMLRKRKKRDDKQQQQQQQEQEQPSLNDKERVAAVTSASASASSSAALSPLRWLSVRVALGLAAIALTFALKSLFAFLLQFEEDTHVFTLLLAKLPPYSYSDFDTHMYLCGQAYNTLPGWAIEDMKDSSLLYRGLFVLGLVVLRLLLLPVLKRALGCARSVGNAGASVEIRSPFVPSSSSPFYAAEQLHVQVAEGADIDSTSVPAFLPAFWLFLCIQSVLFSVLGLLIMRLMMFGTTSLCLLGALVVSPCFVQWALRVLEPTFWTGKGQGQQQSKSKADKEKEAGKERERPWYRRALSGWSKAHWLCYLLVVPVLSSVMYDRAWPQLEFQFIRARKYPNGVNKPLVELMEWVDQHTPQGAVFTGAPHILGGFRAAHGLYTNRSITVHPHYENAEMRLRYRALYQVYGRLSEKAVFAALQPLQAEYLIVDEAQCNGRCFSGAMHDEIANAGWKDAKWWAQKDSTRLVRQPWERAPLNLTEQEWEIPQGKKQPQFCNWARRAPQADLRYFTRLWANSEFAVYRLH